MRAGFLRAWLTSPRPTGPGVLIGWGAERDGLALLQVGLGCDPPAGWSLISDDRPASPRASVFERRLLPSGCLTTASGLRNPPAAAECCLRLSDARPSPAVSQLEPECPRETDDGRIRAVRGGGDKFCQPLFCMWAARRRTGTSMASRSAGLSTVSASAVSKHSIQPSCSARPMGAAKCRRRSMGWPCFVV